MRSRAKRTQVRQAAFRQTQPIEVFQRALAPLALGVMTARQTLLGWLHENGLELLDRQLKGEAEVLAGPKGKHRGDRSHHHWGTAPAELVFGGRKIRVERPRVRELGGGEEMLPSVRAFREEDPLSETVLGQILLGVSTRGFDRSVPGAPPGVAARGASKSAASRRLVRAMCRRMEEHFSQSLAELELAALMVDGLEVGGQTIVVALGIDWGGEKHVLGLEQGASENAAVCAALFEDLQRRGLRLEGKFLCVLDGSQALRKAVSDLFGDLAVVQRCQLHKRRNVKGRLPKGLQTSVDRTIRQAYSSKKLVSARKQLQQLASWLDRQGHTGAARSLREGLEETLTVIKLQLPDTLRRTLSSTNPIENTVGTIRRVGRNVKRWRGGQMAERWAAIGLLLAEKGFHRIKGYRDLSRLRDALAELSPQEAREVA